MNSTNNSAVVFESGTVPSSAMLGSLCSARCLRTRKSRRSLPASKSSCPSAAAVMRHTGIPRTRGQPERCAKWPRPGCQRRFQLPCANAASAWDTFLANGLLDGRFQASRSAPAKLLGSQVSRSLRVSMFDPGGGSDLDLETLRKRRYRHGQAGSVREHPGIDARSHAR